MKKKSSSHNDIVSAAFDVQSKNDAASTWRNFIIPFHMKTLSDELHNYKTKVDGHLLFFMA